MGEDVVKNIQNASDVKTKKKRTKNIFSNSKIPLFRVKKFEIDHFRLKIPYFEPRVEMGNFENGNHAQKYKILSVVDDFKPRLTRTVTARERVEELKS